MNFKQQRLDISMSELQNLQVAIQNTEDEITATNQEYERVGAEFDEKSAMGVSKSEMMTYNAYLHSLIKKVNTLSAKKMNLESAMETKKAEVVQVKSDIKGLEKLKDKQYKEHLKLEQKKSEQVIEEFVVQQSLFN